MKDTMVPIDRAGRIVLPKKVRQELAIKPGDKFKISVHGIEVTLSPDKEKAGLIRKGRALVFSTRGKETITQESVNALLEGERVEHTVQIMGRLPK